MKAHLLLGALAIVAQAHAGDDVLIRNATVHTMTSSGVLADTDLLVRDGRLVAIGTALDAPQGAEIINARGNPVTPGLFGGFTQLGLREISYEPAAEDDSLSLGPMRPEFDVSLAFNPDSAAVGVSATEGITFAELTPTSGASIIAGQGALTFLGGQTPAGPRALFVNMGGDADAAAGGSRAAQAMLLRQALLEACEPKRLLPGDQRLLTPTGRSVLREYATGRGLIVFDVDRVSDIRNVIQLIREHHLNAAIAGGSEAWRVAAALAAARIPVILDPLANIPADFDSVGATLENAARLHGAGVTIAFSFFRDEPIRTPRLRQAAGNAVAHGLPAQAALVALTRAPAEIFGAGAVAGTLQVGKLADLVLWSGDPLEVTTVADRVFCGGRALDMSSRESRLRDRYLPARLRPAKGEG